MGRIEISINDSNGYGNVSIILFPTMFMWKTEQSWENVKHFDNLNIFIELLLYEYIHKYLSEKILVIQLELIITRVKVSEVGLTDPV